jgi:hypothetical protein
MFVHDSKWREEEKGQKAGSRNIQIVWSAEQAKITISIAFSFRCFGPKCGGCGNGIIPQDYVRKARDKVYHLRCFTCSACSKQLSTGEVLYLQPGEETLLCKDDYLKNHTNAGKREEAKKEKISIFNAPDLFYQNQHHPKRWSLLILTLMSHYRGVPRSLTHSSSFFFSFFSCLSRIDLSFFLFL